MKYTKNIGLFDQMCIFFEIWAIILGLFLFYFINPISRQQIYPHSAMAGRRAEGGGRRT